MTLWVTVESVEASIADSDIPPVSARSITEARTAPDSCPSERRYVTATWYLPARRDPDAAVSAGAGGGAMPHVRFAPFWAHPISAPFAQKTRSATAAYDSGRRGVSPAYRVA